MIKQGLLQAAVTTASIAILLTSGTPDANAHHGWSEYNSEQPMTLTGEIQQVGSEGSHTLITLGTPDKVWNIVLAPPARMESRGLSQDALQPGLTVSLVGYIHREEANEMRAERITVGNQTIELR